MSKLTDITQLVKHYCNSTKSGFFKVCSLLYDINKKEIYKEKYQTFDEYIEYEGFEFTTRHAYNYIKIWEMCGDLLYSDSRDVKLLQNVSITHLLQIANISDKEIREEISKRAVKKKMTVEQLSEEIEMLKSRKCDPNKPPVLPLEEEKYYKVKNDGVRIKKEIETLFICFEDIKVRFNEWKKLSLGYSEFKWIEEEIEGEFEKWKNFVK